MEAHDRCDLDGCTLGRAHVGPCSGPPCPECGRASAFKENDWYCSAPYSVCPHEAPIPVPASAPEVVRQPMPAASPLASEMRLPAEPSDLDGYLLDLEAEAREADESARHHARRAVELRAMAKHLRAYRDSRGLRAWAKDDKPQPAPVGVASTGRGSNP